MKYVINNCSGGFNVKRSIANKYGFDRYNVERNNKKLIELIESGVDCNGMYAELILVDIPDNATDYTIIDYDGCESIIYVVDGKMHRIFG